MLTDEQKRLMRNLTPDLIFEIMGNNPDMTLKEMWKFRQRSTEW